MNTSGASKAIGIVVLVVVLGGGVFATSKYLQSRPQGVPPMTRATNPARPKAGFGSRPTDFADPRTSTLHYVSDFEKKQGVRPNTTIGGRR